MYLRWKKKKRKRRYNESVPKVTLCAVIVESQRIKGTPEQRIVQYLGSIREEHLDFSYSRDIFWRNVRRKLHTLDLNTKDREAINKKLREMVPENKHKSSASSPPKNVGD